MSAKSTATSAELAQHARFRNDIQGLRAFAVLAVIADHLFARPVGGFVGVDVFFVISGYLITGLLIREHGRSGKISIADFYRRRVRRIMPVAVLVLIVTVATAWLVFRPGRATVTTVDSLWALFFGANWHFAAIGTDYLRAAGPLSPVQHFWSLGVEEQFYLAWPWLLIILFGVLIRFAARKPSQTVVLGVVVATVGVGSFAFAVWETHTAGTIAYFSTFSRAWELAAGAFLAVIAAHSRRLPDWIRPVLAWLGIVGLAWSVLFIGPSFAFPAPWGAVPVLSTCLVILAGDGGRQRFIWLLTNPISGYLGRISYSLYLWHFPAIVVLSAVLIPAGLRFSALSLALTVGLSVASYHLVEEPIRASGWLIPRRGGAASRRSKRTSARLVASGVAGAAMLAIVLAGSLTAATALAPPPPASTSLDPSGKVLTQAALTTQITNALSTTSWPRLNPSIDGLMNAIAPEWVKDDCLNITDSNINRCVFGSPSAQHTAVILGDSVAISWMPALEKALGSKEWKIQALTYGECPAINVSATRYTGDGSPDLDFEKTCMAHHSWAIKQVKRIQPTLIVVASAESTLIRLSDGKTGMDAVDEWQVGTTQTLRALHSATDGRIVVLSSPPTVKDVKGCATAINSPSECISTVDTYYVPMARAEDAAVRAINAPRDVFRIDSLPWFCVGERCPAFVGSTPTYVDSTHLTAAYSALLAPLLRSSLGG